MIVQGSCKNAVDGHAVFIDIGLAFAGYLVEQQTNFGRCDLFDGKRTDPLAFINMKTQNSRVRQLIRAAQTDAALPSPENQ